MNLYETLSQKLQKLSIADFIMIKWIYLFLGILLATAYHSVFYLSVWFYLILTVVAALPPLMFTLSFKGNIIEKTKQYLAHNNPSNQVLVLISCFSFGITVAVLFPILTGFHWYVYLILMLILAIKPLKKVLSGNSPYWAKIVLKFSRLCHYLKTL